MRSSACAVPAISLHLSSCTVRPRLVCVRLQAAQAKLQESKDAKKKVAEDAGQEEEDDDL